jgi:long-subunit acyl-CoA synthetase (AMP-forming)
MLINLIFYKTYPMDLYKHTHTHIHKTHDAKVFQVFNTLCAECDKSENLLKLRTKLVYKEIQLHTGMHIKYIFVGSSFFISVISEHRN